MVSVNKPGAITFHIIGFIMCVFYFIPPRADETKDLNGIK